MSNEQILREEFLKLRLDIIAKYDEKGMRASGKFERETYVEAKAFEATLKGPGYAEQLQDGREPTTGQPGARPLTAIILDWINDKGIRPIEANMKLTSLAFLIARKIHREGWDRKDYGGVELISEVITPERVQKIIDRVSEFNVAQFASEVKSMFNELAVA